jgi:putative ABC transport system ATP-binding protein
MIRFEHIHKTYSLGKTKLIAIDDLSLEIGKGEFVALAGPSGSGKTTLLNLAGCLDKPDSGRIWLDGEDVSRTPLPALAGMRRTHLGFVFQTFNLVPVLTARFNSLSTKSSAVTKSCARPLLNGTVNRSSGLPGSRMSRSSSSI